MNLHSFLCVLNDPPNASSLIDLRLSEYLCVLFISQGGAVVTDFIQQENSIIRGPGMTVKARRPSSSIEKKSSLITPTTLRHFHDKSGKSVIS